MLIVDDDATLRLTARAALERFGLGVDEAEDGASAVAKCQQSLPALVALDLMMPGMDGFEACRQLRQEHPDLPILIMTGLDDVESIERAYDHGATDFALKPINWSIFPHRVLYMLRASDAFDHMRIGRETAEAANRAKTSFLANMSHEIRTPMTAILGYLDVLMEEGVMCDASSTAVLAVDRIRANAQALLGLIDDIIDLSRIEKGQVSLAFAPCSPAYVVDTVIGLFRHQAETRGLDLQLELHDDLPDYVRTDRLRLRQILVNLVSNALKFTNDGSVRVRIGPAPDADDERLEITVTDTGIGVPRDELPGIFGEFVRGTNRSMECEGTGLGLAIVRRLVDAMGGSIDARSRPGKGTRFRVVLPAPVVDRAEVEAEAPPTFASSDGFTNLGLRVLVVEDGEDNQRLIERLLERAGNDVTIAPNGLEGIRRVAEAERAELPFDLILMDMQMPIMDGFEATRRLRDAGLDCPVVALTAHAMHGDREACIAAGCDDYVTKPIDRNRLFDVMTSLVDKSTTTSAGRRS